MTDLPRLAVSREQAALLSNGFNDLTWGKDAFALRLPERPTMWHDDDHGRQTLVAIPEDTRVEVGWWDDGEDWWEQVEDGHGFVDEVFHPAVPTWHPVATATLASVQATTYQTGRTDGTPDHLVSLTDVRSTGD